MLIITNFKERGGFKTIDCDIFLYKKSSIRAETTPHLDFKSGIRLEFRKCFYKGD
jgi:hypothetical protein